MTEPYEKERDDELAAGASGDRNWEVLWHQGYQGYTTTELTAKSKPNKQEAAQLVAIKEDEDVTSLTVDAVREA